MVAPAVSLKAGSSLGSTSLVVHLAWSAVDASGIFARHLQRQANGGAWVAVAIPTATATSIDQTLTIGTSYRYRLTATDRAGNASGWTYGHTFKALLVQQSSGGVLYHGRWTTSRLPAASGKSLRYATVTNAYATYRFSGSSVAWVAYRGPNRGSAKVYVDGAYKGTVSLYAAGYHARPITYVFSAAANGSHLLKIVVVGTSHHPRVDVDALVRLVLS